MIQKYSVCSNKEITLKIHITKDILVTVSCDMFWNFSAKGINIFHNIFAKNIRFFSLIPEKKCGSYCTSFKISDIEKSILK